MKIRVFKNEFARQLSKNIVCCGKNKSLPIFSNVFCNIQGNVMELKSSNSAIEITTKIQIENDSDESIQFCFQPNKLHALIQSVDCDVLDFKIEENSLKLTYGRNKSTYSTMSVDDFPILQPQGEKIEVNIDEKFFKEIFVAKDFAEDKPIRPALGSVLIDFKESTLNFVGTDAHVLYKQSITIENDKDRQVLLGKENIACLKNIFNPSDIQTMSVYNNCVSFETEDCYCVLLTNNAQYPKWQQIIPKDKSQYIQLEVKELVCSLNRLRTITPLNDTIVVEVSNENITLSASNEEENIKETMEFVKQNGATIRIGLNLKYLIQALNTLETRYCNLYYTEPNRAIVITEDDNMSENKERLCLVMPMILND